MFKIVDGELKVFNKAILSTQNNLKNLETQTANLNYYTSGGNHVKLQNAPIIAQSQTVSNLTKLNNAFNAYNNNLTKSTELQNAYIKSVGNQNQALGNYLAGLDGAKASMGGYIRSLIGAKAASIGLQLASIALNAALTMGVSLLIQGVINLGAWLWSFVPTAENLAKKFKEITEELIELNSEIDNLNSELESVQDRINELSSKGTLSITEEAELKRLRLESAELQRQINLKRTLQSEKSKQQQKEFVDKYKNLDREQTDEIVGFVSDEYIKEHGREKASKKISEYSDMIETNQEDIQALYDAGYVYGTNKEVDARIDAMNRAIDAYMYAKNKVGDAEVDWFSGIISRFPDAQMVLEELGNSGEITEEKLKNVLNGEHGEELKKLLTYLSSIGAIDLKDVLGDDRFDELDTNLDGYIDTTEAAKLNTEDFVKLMPSMVAEFKNEGDEAKTASENIDKMTVSLSNLEKASDNIKAIGSAYKELSSDGYITIKTLSEIKTAAGLSGNEWEEYQIKLLNAKAGSSEFNQIMSDLTYKILDNTFAGAELNDLTEQQIIATLRENGVINASAVAHDWLAKAKAKEKIASMELVKGSNLDIAALTSEATACGVTKNAYLELVAKEILFNRNDLDVDDKIKKLNQIAVAAGVAGINMDDLNSKFGSQGEKHKYIKENGGKITTTYKMPSSSATSPVNDLSFYNTNGRVILSSDGITEVPWFEEPTIETYLYEYAQEIYSYDFEDGTKLTDVDDAVKYGAMLSLGKRITDITNNITIPNYGGVGTGNEHSYEDLTDAIINRINLRSKELEQQEESIDNALELAKYEKNNEKRYEKQVSLLTEKSTIQKQRLGEIVKANNDIHKVAEELRNSTPDWDEESWFDSQGEATEAYLNLYNNSTKEQKEALSDQFDKLSKLKKAWYENDEDRLALEKDILDTEEEILDLRGEYFNDATDFHSSYFDSRISVLKAQYELENSIAEARHELNKELETSKTMYEYLDEETRELLFNQEDYNELAEELLSIEKMGARLQRQYERDLENATLETVEEITANYERQYETLMKSYEIAKADLEIAKKKQQLNNVLNERKVRMFLNGQWQWVADTEEVARAKSELADAEYAKRVAKAGLKQQESINNLTLQQDQLGIVVKKFEGGVITLDEAVADAAEAIGKLPKALQEMYKNASKGNTSSFSGDGSSSLKGSSSGGGNKSSSSSGGNSSSTMNITVQTGNIYPEGVKPIVTPFPGGDSSSNGVNTTDQYVTSGSGIINSNPNWDGKKKGSVGIEKHADGTRYTPGGLTLMGEEGSEIYITASGRLIPINQPTIGNIPSGGVVFNREQMNGIRSLWDMSNMKLSSDKTQIERQPQQIDQSQDNRIIINGMTVDSGSSDGQALISALRRYVSNH